MKFNKYYPMKFVKFFDFINVCDEENLVYFCEFIQTENPRGGTSCDLCFFKVFLEEKSTLGPFPSLILPLMF